MALKQVLAYVTNADDFDSLVDLKKLESDGDILQFLVAKSRSLVVLAEALSAEHLDERDETQAVGQVLRQVSNVLVDCLEMLVRPARESVLLDQLPLGVAGQIALRRAHRRRIHDDRLSYSNCRTLTTNVSLLF